MPNDTNSTTNASAMVRNMRTLVNEHLIARGNAVASLRHLANIAESDQEREIFLSGATEIAAE